jgi:hypothetical protein
MNIFDRIAAKFIRRTEGTAVAVGSTTGPGPTGAPNAAAIQVDLDEVEREESGTVEEVEPEAGERSDS